MEEKALRLLKRLEEVEELLGCSDILSDQDQYRRLSQEHARLSEVKRAWSNYQTALKNLKESKALLKEEKDPDLSLLIQEEITSLEGQLDPLKRNVESLLVPPDPRDSRDIIVELRAVTGGDEAALF